MALRVMTSLGIERRAHPLIGVGRFLDHSPASERPLLSVSVVGRSTTAAENAVEPEDTGTEGEDSTEPGGDVDIVSKGGFDVVGSEDMVECSDKTGEEGDRCDGCGDCECGCDLGICVSNSSAQTEEVAHP